MIARLIVLTFGATVLLAAVRRLRAYQLKERHVLLFIFLGLPFLVLALWPAAIGWMAVKLGISYITVSVLCVTAFFFLMVFELFTIVSLQERRIATLAQIVGIMMEKQGMGDGVEGKTWQPPGDLSTPAPPPPPPQPPS